MPRAGKGLPKG